MVHSYYFYLSILFNATFIYYYLLGSKTTNSKKIPRDRNSNNPALNISLFEEEDKVSGWHGMRLTHLIIPFHSSHLSKLENNVKTWAQFLPCSSEGIETPFPNNQYHLIFYSSTDSKKKEKISEIEGRLTSLIGNLTKPVMGCFASWEVQHANLSSHSDTYYRGTRLMLEKLLLGKVRIGNYSIPLNNNTVSDAGANIGYAFYMEPDCLPIRNNWLNALDWNSRWPNPIFWLKGSIYRGSNKGTYATRHPPQYYHINGNALINLNDRSLRSFYLKHYKPWAQAAATVRERSFDTDFWRFLHNLDTINVVKGVYHRFVYTDVVQNFWRSSYSIAKIRNEHPNTFLIHGGYPKP